MKFYKKIALKLIIVLLLLVGSFSCQKKNEYSSLELGIYTETYPVNGRTKINFIDREKLVIIKGEDIKFQDEFKYEICVNAIKLTNVSHFIIPCKKRNKD